MKEIKKSIKLKDISDQQKLNVEQLSKVIGGMAASACTANVCEQNLEDFTQYCNGDGICESGIGGGGSCSSTTCIFSA